MEERRATAPNPGNEKKGSSGSQWTGGGRHQSASWRGTGAPLDTDSTLTTTPH